jgi:hypothetical protein
MTQKAEVSLHGVVDAVIAVILVSHSVPLCPWRGGGGERRALPDVPGRGRFRLVKHVLQDRECSESAWRGDVWQCGQQCGRTSGCVSQA